MQRYVFLKPKAFDKWVNQMYANYENDFEYSEMIDAAFRDTKHIFTYVRNVNNGNVFSAKCNKNDEYDAKTGIAIAYAKATAHKIAVRVIKKINDPNKLMINDTVIIKFMFKDKMETVTLNEERLNRLKCRFDLLDYCYLVERS